MIELFGGISNTANLILQILTLLLGCYVIGTFIKSVDFISRLIVSLFSIIKFIILIPFKIIKFII